MGDSINASSSFNKDKNDLALQQNFIFSENTEKPELGSGSLTVQKTNSGIRK